MTPWTVALQASLSMGFFRQEYWCGLPFLLQCVDYILIKKKKFNSQNILKKNTTVKTASGKVKISESHSRAKQDIFISSNYLPQIIY